MPRPYEYLDHTADYALRAWGKDFPQLLANALEGFLCLLADTTNLTPCADQTFEVQGDSREQVVIRALKRVLELRDDGDIALRARVLWADAAEASVTVGTVPLGEHRDRLGAAVKAVTYHNVQIREHEGGLAVELVFDT
ncbi:archease [bacterium]|nr:archease [bacterium]